MGKMEVACTVFSLLANYNTRFFRLRSYVGSAVIPVDATAPNQRFGKFVTGQAVPQGPKNSPNGVPLGLRRIPLGCAIPGSLLKHLGERSEEFAIVQK